MAATVGRPCQGDWRPSGLTPAEASGEVLDVSDFSFFFAVFFTLFASPRSVSGLRIACRNCAGRVNRVADLLFSCLLSPRR